MYQPTKHQRLILFDGVCNVCNRAVQFIIKRDSQKRFLFAPLQTEAAQDLVKGHQISLEPETIVLIKGKQAFVMSDAVLEILKDLDGQWHWLRVFRFLPKALRDYCYVLFGKHRYRLFGKRQQCMVPEPHISNRFLSE